MIFNKKNKGSSYTYLIFLPLCEHEIKYTSDCVHRCKKMKEIWFVHSFAIHAGSPRNSEPQPGENVDQRRAGDLSQIASFYPSISILGRPRLLPASASITYFLNQYRIWNFALFDCCEASWSDFFFQLGFSCLFQEWTVGRFSWPTFSRFKGFKITSFTLLKCTDRGFWTLKIVKCSCRQQ